MQKNEEKLHLYAESVAGIDTISKIISEPALTDELAIAEAEIALQDEHSPAVLWTARELRRVLKNIMRILRSYSKFNEEIAEVKESHSPQPRTIFNLNEDVYVRLTERGRQILRDNHAEAFRVASRRPDYVEPKEDEQGFSKWPLYMLFQQFGTEMVLGNHPLPFDTEIYCNPNEAKQYIRPGPKDQYEIYDRLREFMPLPDHCIHFKITMDAHEVPILEARSYLAPFKKSADGSRLCAVDEKWEWVKVKSKEGFPSEDGALEEI